MATRAERRALAFLGGVLVVGTVLRLAGAFSDRASVPAATRDALARQIAAVDSASGASRGAAGARVARGGGGGRGRAGRARPSADRPPARAPDESAPAPLPQPDRRLVDLDRATAADMERLPRIGPALAQRILADRERNGAFGSLEALTRVRGIGPVMAESLRSRVTFSGTGRPSNALEPTAVTPRRTARRPARRGSRT